MPNRPKSRRYPPETKLEAIRLVLIEGRKVPEVSRKLRIRPTTLYAWVAQAREDSEHPVEQQPVAQTQVRAQIENEILGLLARYQRKKASN